MAKQYVVKATVTVICNSTNKEAAYDEASDTLSYSNNIYDFDIESIEPINEDDEY